MHLMECKKKIAFNYEIRKFLQEKNEVVTLGPKSMIYCLSTLLDSSVNNIYIVVTTNTIC